MVNNTLVNSVNNTYTFDTIKSNQTIRVVFKLQTFSINAIAGNGGSISPQGISNVNYGATPSYTITPNTGYIIDSIIVNGNKVTNVNNYTFDTIKSNQTIQVAFKLQSYTITASAGNGGSISSQGISNVNYGATPNYTITPNTGYLIDSIFVNNSWINNVNNNYTFDTIKSNQTIRVVFKLQIFSITASAGNGGSISPQGISNVNYGATPSYNITPNMGYQIDSIIVNNVRVNNNNNYTFDSVKSNQTIRVTFKLIQYIITGFVNASQGSISTIRDTVNYGANLRVTYQANAGNNLAYILINNNIVIYDSLVGYTFNNITQNYTITPIFTFITIPNPATNIIAVGGNAQATVSFAAPVNNGGSPIIRYNISTTEGNITASGVASPIVVTGLTNGANYRFVVKAVNAIGSSVSSDSSNGVTPRSSGKYINTIVFGGQISNTLYVDSGANFVVTYTNKAGYVLDSIYINGAYSAGATADSISQYTFKNVRADSAIKVVYKITTYTITSNAGNGGSISPQGVSNVNYGATPRFTITPNTGYFIDSVLVNNTLVNSVNNTYTFDTIKSNQIIRVVFKLQTFSINAIAGNGGSISPQGISNVNYGATPSYTITPNTGYIIDSIIVNGNKVTNVNNYTFDTIKSNQTIQVAFKLQSYTITASAGNGGSISPQGISNVNYGATPNYSITPNTGYLIDSIFVNNSWINNVNNNYTFDTIKSNQTIRVVFKLQIFSITASAGNGGSISPQGISNVNYGATPSYTITPNMGYQIDSIIVNNVRVNNNNNYTFDTIKANQTIRVTFKLQTYTITAIAGNGGTISPQGVGNANYGTTPTYTITPNTGYIVDSIFVNNTQVNINNNNYTFDTIKSNQTIRVVFKLQTFIVTSSAGNGGSINFAGDSVVNYGSNIVYSITPNTGYTMDSLIIDGAVQPNTNNYSFSNISANRRIRVTFKLIQFIITGIVNASQGRISTIRDTVNYGSNLRVTYQANSGYNLSNIIVDEVYINDSLNGYTFTNITKNHSITPIFTFITIPNPPTKISAVGGNGQATVSFTAPVNNGGSPIIRYNISTTEGNITASGVGSPIVVTGLTNGTSYRFVVNAINAIGSSFSSDTSNAITTIVNGKYVNTIVVGGQIINTAFVDSGSNFVVTYTNKLGYVLDSIYINGEYSARATADSISQYTFNNITADSSIKVIYKITTYTITANAGNGGSISPQGVSIVNYGATPRYSITPNTGYKVDSIFVNNTNININNIYYIFDSVKSNQIIRVVFKLQTYTISAIAGNGGSISPQGISSVTYGDTPRYIIAPNIGYQIDSIIINGNKVPNANSYTFDSVKSNQTIYAYFKLQTYTITAIAGNGGIISSQGISNVNYGATPKYIITPNTGYLIDSILINNTKININNNSYTFDSIKSNQTIRIVFKLQNFNIVSSAGSGGSIGFSGDSIVNYGSNIAYIINPNTGYTIDSLIIDGLLQTNTNNYTFSNITANHTIRVTFKAMQFIITGFVNASQGKISTTQDTVNYGSSLRVTYQAKSGYKLAYIIVDNNSIYYDSIVGYTFTNINQNHNILAIFANNITVPTPPTNIIAVGGNGQATVRFTEPINNGGSPIYKYIISTIEGNITASGVASPIVVTGLTNATSYRFVVNAVNVIGNSLSSDTSNAITTSANGKFINTIVVGGQISNTAFLDAGANFVVTYTNSVGYILDSIIINGLYNAAASVDSVTHYTFKNVRADSSIKVVYKLATFDISSSAGIGGTISPQGVSKVNYGSMPHYTITPNTGYFIESIFVNNILVNNVNNNYTFDSIKANQSIRVVFKLQSYTVTTIAGNGGNISPQGINNVNYGTTPGYTITPNSGYEIDSIIVNGIKVMNVNYLILDSVKTNQSIRIVFKPQTFTIFASARNGGSISPQGNTTVKYGDRQIFTISPNNGYIIDSIVVNGVTISNTNVLLLDTVKSNLSIIVTFKLKTFTIISKAGLNGKINTEGEVTVNIGASRIYSITPDEGYEIDSLIIDDIVLFNTNVYIFNDVQSNHIIRATFKIKIFKIISSAGIGGTISPLDTLLVNYKAKPIYTITANEGYIIDSLIIDGNKIDNSYTYTFGTVTDNHTIRVTFKLKPIIKECPSTKVTPTIVRVGNALQSDITSFAKHKWYLDGNFKDSTKLNNYSPSTSGVYTLLGLDTNECESNFSKKYYYSNTCIIPTGRISNAVSIQGNIIDYPNQIIIKWCPDVIENNLNIKVIDMATGVLLINEFIPANLSTYILNKQKINSNIYLIQVLDSKGEVLETSDFINK